MTLTRREKQILLEACERIATDEAHYSCCAINYHTIEEKYKHFYSEENIKIYNIGEAKSPEARSWRQTLLLFFCEAHEEVE